MFVEDPLPVHLHGGRRSHLGKRPPRLKRGRHIQPVRDNYQVTK